MSGNGWTSARVAKRIATCTSSTSTSTSYRAPPSVQGTLGAAGSWHTSSARAHARTMPFWQLRLVRSPQTCWALLAANAACVCMRVREPGHQDQRRRWLRQVREAYRALLAGKAARWRAQLADAGAAVRDLAAFYAALRAMPRAAPTADLSDWFRQMEEQARGARALPGSRCVCVRVSVHASVAGADMYHAEA